VGQGMSAQQERIARSRKRLGFGFATGLCVRSSMRVAATLATLHPHTTILFDASLLKGFKLTL
jgi:hypothetical protein